MPSTTAMDQDGLTSPPQETKRPNVKLTDLTPRPYQLEILEKAKDQNVIAVMETGTGKTLIAVLLIQHMTDLEAHGRVSVFLVPTVHLVHQQSAYIEANTRLNVQAFHGGTSGIGIWQGTDWQEHLKLSQVLVMTPDIFKTALDRAFVKMNQFNLIVLDECHHARGNHPYNQIMRVHYSRCIDNERPKVFGMTASPVAAKESSEVSIENIESNLQCVAIRPTFEVHDYVPTPVETVILYEENSSFPEPPKRIVALSTYGDSSSVLQVLNQKLQSIEHIFQEMGSWCADRAIEIAIERYLKKRKMKWLSEQSTEHATLVGSSLNDLPTDADIPYMTEPCQKMYAFYKHESSLGSWGSSALAPKDEELSPKVMALIHLLKQRRNGNNLCGIVFVQERLVAEVLSLVLSAHPSLSGIRFEYIIGGKKSFDPTKFPAFAEMTARAQQDTLARFRSGETNVLIGTQVIEEGLDVKPCSFVIRFDMVKTLVNYIQSKGRARALDSEFLVLAAKGTLREKVELDGFISRERELKDQLATKSTESSNLELRTVDDDDIYVHEKSGATLTKHNALGLLQQYCDMLPHDRYCNPKPEYQIFQPAMGQFSAKLHMPANVPQSCRTLVLDYNATSKDGAKREVAFQMIKKLVEAKELDEHFRATTPRAQAKKDAQGDGLHPFAIVSKLQSRKMHKSYVINPSPWSTCLTKTTECYFNAIQLACNGFPPTTLSVALVTKTPLSEIEPFEFQMNGMSHECRFVTFQPPCSLDCLDNLRAFHFELFSKLVRTSMDYNEPWTVLTAPLRLDILETFSVEEDDPSTVIDFELLNSFNKNVSFPSLKSVIQSTSFDKLILKDMVVYDPSYYQRIYMIHEICKNMTPTTEIDIPGSNLKCIRDFYTKRLGYDDVVDTDQPLALAQGFPYILNRDCSQMEKEKVYLIPQVARVLPFRKEMIEGSLGLPLIMNHMRVRLLAKDVIHRLVKPYVHPPPPPQTSSDDSPRKKRRNEDTMLVSNDEELSDVQMDICESTVCPAETTDADVAVMEPLPCTVEAIATAICSPNAQLGIDYERYETLGDAFLKVVQTTHIFVEQVEKNEGFMSCARSQIENNKSFFKHTRRLGLDRCILDEPLERKKWKPPTEGVHRRLISQKMIADILEAIIGACLISNGHHAAVKAIRLLLGSEYQETWKGYHELHWKNLKVEDENTSSQFDDATLAKMKLLEDAMGYTFHDKRLLATALTHQSAFSMGASYQRLEFLGDAVLCYGVTRFLYDQPEMLSPEYLSVFRSHYVCNNTLAFVSQSLQLPRLMNHGSLALGVTISDFAKECEAMTATLAEQSLNLDTLSEEDLMFWKKLKYAGKAIADIYESTIGAIFLDSGFNLDLAESVIRKTLCEPGWPRIRSLLRCAKNNTVLWYSSLVSAFMWNVLKCSSLEVRVQPNEYGDFECQYVWHNEEVIGKANGESRFESKENAAKFAYTHLTSIIISDYLEHGKCKCNLQQRLNGNDELEDLEEDSVLV